MNISNNSIGIWISTKEDIEKIPIIINYFKDSVRDIFLISDESIYTPDYAVISSFYINFYNGCVVFLSLDDLLSNKSNLRSEKIYLLSSSQDIINSSLDKTYFNNITIIES